jgi:uncharacterized protein
MHVDDPVYGTALIEEPVLLALIASSPVQRLRGVLQHGITALLGITRPVTRYDHSLGAMILVRRLGGSLEEQAAALLHDVSHTAFSHVIDYVFDNHEEQSYHDEHKIRYVSQTEIPALLADHGFDWRYIMDEQAFPLLEQPAPRLCADRLDYFLRDSLDLSLATPAFVQNALRHLVVGEGRIMCADLAAAHWLAETYLAADRASWANFREVGLYELAARAIRRALEIGLLIESDLWLEDRAVWDRLQTAGDHRLQELLRLLNPATRFVWDEEQPSFLVSTKLRTIDPDVLGRDGSVQPLSALDPGFAHRRQRYLARRAGRWPMRVIPAPA